nr:hypothetical protein [Lacticaseibacillus saniviri]
MKKGSEDMSSNGLEDVEGIFNRELHHLDTSLSTSEVEITKLFPDAFMAAHTKSTSMDQFMADLGINSEEQLHEYPIDQLNAKVAAESDFASWDDMLKAAGKAYLENK